MRAGLLAAALVGAGGCTPSTGSSGQRPAGIVDEEWRPMVVSGSCSQDRRPSGLASGELALETVMEVAGQCDWWQHVPGIDAQVRYRLHGYVDATAAGAVEVQWMAGATALGAESVPTPAGAWAEVRLDDLQPPPQADSVTVLLHAYAAGAYEHAGFILVPRDEDVWTVAGAFPMGVYDPPSATLTMNGDFEDPPRSTTRDDQIVLNGILPPSDGSDPELPDSAPAFWARWIDSGAATLSWVQTGTNGTGAPDHAVRIAMTAAGQADWRQLVPAIDPALRYRLDASITATKVDPGSHGVEVQWVDANGAPLDRSTLAATAAGQAQSLSAAGLQPPAGAVSAWVLLRAYAPGMYLFDNVSFALDVSDADRVLEAARAGFDLVMAGNAAQLAGAAAAGVKTFWETDPTQPRVTLQPRLETAAASPALALWQSVDEPAWSDRKPLPDGTVGCTHSCEVDRWPRCDGLCPSAVANGQASLRAGDPAWGGAPRAVWVNHAPRGKVFDPSNFSLLAPYNEGADIVSMDIYPVPPANGHCILRDQGPGCVGEYVDVLRSLVTARGRQAKPVWIVGQAFGWPDLNAGYRAEAAIEIHWLDAGGRAVLVTDPRTGRAAKAVHVLPVQRRNQWDHVIAQRLHPPAGAAVAAVLLRSYYLGEQWFDDVHLVDDGGGEALQDPGFDSGASHPTYWTRWEDEGSPAFLWQDGAGRGGGKAVGIRNVAGGLVEADWRQYVPVDSSRTFSLSGWILSRVRPTWAETRFMAYDAIVHGARGLVYWGLRSTPHDARIWADLKALAGEIATLSPALVRPVSLRTLLLVAGVAPGLEGILLDGDDALYLVLANRVAQPTGQVRLSVGGPPLESAACLFEDPGCAALAGGNEVETTLGSWDVHVVQLR